MLKIESVSLMDTAPLKDILGKPNYNNFNEHFDSTEPSLFDCLTLKYSGVIRTSIMYKINILTIINSIIVYLLCSCTNNDIFFDDIFELEEPLYYELAKSSEFIEYKISEFIFINTQSDVNSEDFLDISQEYNDMESKYNRFIQRFPQYEFLNNAIRDEMLLVASSYNSTLNKYTNKRSVRFITRCSNTDPEKQSVRNKTYLDQNKNNPVLAKIVDYQACPTLMSAINNHCKGETVETGGFVYSDQSAIWYKTDDAQEMHFYPIYFKEENTTITSIFHYHPDYSGPSDDDYESGKSLYDEFGIYETIVYNKAGAMYKKTWKKQ